MKPTNLLRAFLLGSAFLAASPSLQAANIWDGGGADNSTQTANNWDNNAVPTSATSLILTFDGSTRTTIAWDGINTGLINLRGFNFASGASAFTINTGTNSLVQFVGGTTTTPLLNSSSNLQTLGIQSHVFYSGTKTFDAGTSGLALNGGIVFRGDSMASGTNQLDLIGSGNSTVSSISRLGFGGTATTALVKNGTGKWTITGDVTDTGATTITQGTLEYQGSVSSSSIANSGALIFNNAGTQSYANNISGGGSVTKQGAGTLTLSGTKSYTGATIITGGTLSVASIANGGSVSGIGQSTAIASNLVFDGGTLSYTGATVASNRAFTINSGKTATIEVTSGASNLSLIGVTGAATNGALTKTGAGTLTLSGNNTYTGATTVSQGTLKMGFSGSTAVSLTNASFETDAGTVNSFQGLDITGWTNGTGIEQGTSNTFSGISGVSGLPNYNAATNFKWAFIQGAQTMSQNVNVATDGFYNVGFAASGRTGSFGPLNIQVLVDGVNQTNGTTITPVQGTWNTYTSNGVFLAAGSHTLAFSFINALGGDRSSTLDQVSLTGATQGSLAGNTTLSIASGATFDINGTSQTVASLSDSGGGGGSVINSNSVLSSVLTVGSTSGNTTFSGAIGGGGGTLGLTKTGNSIQILTGTNTYTGATTVSGGILAVNGSLANTTTTIQSGGILQGSGTIAGSVTVEGNGILAPGNSIESIGTGALSFLSASTYAYELQTDLYAGTPNLAGDLTYTTSTLDIASGAILTLTDLATSTALLSGSKLTLISYGSGWTGSELFTYLGSALADNSTFTLGANQWLFDYDDTAEGLNFATDSPNGQSYITMTVIPEPGSALLGSLGLLILLRRRRTHV